jgi:hypothetical protein
MGGGYITIEGRFPRVWKCSLKYVLALSEWDGIKGKINKGFRRFE